MTIWHCHIAMSLDGKIARAEGFYRKNGWRGTGRRDDGQVIFVKDL
jgi:riboflavin biosynthesis pyrimidine reductase